MKSVFDEYARGYRDILEQSVRTSGGDYEFFAKYKTDIVAQSVNRKIESLLDVGCGDGLSERYFRQVFEGVSLIGVDVSAESVNVASERCISKCSFLSYDGLKLPLQDNMVDVVFMSCVLHHVPHPQHEGLLRECARVLKKDGEIFIFEHNPRNPFTQRIVHGCPFDRDAKLLRSEELEKTLSIAGFRHQRIMYTLFFPRHEVFKGLHWLEKYLGRCPFGGQYFIHATQ